MMYIFVNLVLFPYSSKDWFESSFIAKMKKFRKFFFGRIQSDGTEIKESIAKHFFETFKQLFFKPILPVNKSIIVLLEENSNLIETYFFGGMKKTLSAIDRVKLFTKMQEAMFFTKDKECKDFKKMFFKPTLPVNKSKFVFLEKNSSLIETYVLGSGGNFSP